MTTEKVKDKAGNAWITTENPAIFFEDTQVGRLKEEIWNASMDEIESILEDYGIPSESELTEAGSYIQTTPRKELVENRRKNDIVFIPVGSTERHGEHCPSGHDIFQTTQILEGVRRYTEKQGHPVNIAWPPLPYGGHPYHHIGMPGTVPLRGELVREILISVMLGLWNDGFRKQIIINNHGHLWQLKTALHEFMNRYQLPGIFQVWDWTRAVREFFMRTGTEESLETDFVHAAEAETSLGLLLFPDKINMEYAEECEGLPESFISDGYFDKSLEQYRRPHRWSEGEGHSEIELTGTPKGSVGSPQKASAEKAKRPVAATLKYLTLVHDEIREAFPPGEVPPVEKTTMRTEEEMEPYLKEPQSEGWKSVYNLDKRGY